MGESEAIEKARSGDREALNKLLTDNYSILKGYAIKLTSDVSLAQDITQEAMLRAVLNINKYRHEAKFSTYLITIATNLYRDYLRKNRRIEVVHEVVEVAGENPEDVSLRSMDYKEAMNILSSLPYEKRAVFILKHYYGYKYDEISSILKCPVGTVRSRLHNCIEDIKKEMKKRGVM